MSKNYKVVVTTDSTGKATATATERSFGEAIGDSLLSLVKTDEASVGIVKTAVVGTLCYGTALFTAYRNRGGFSWNPF